MSRELRHNARKIVLEKLFETQYIKDNPNDGKLDVIPAEDLQELSDVDTFDKQFADELFDETLTHLDELDLLIKKFAPEWPINKIPRTDLAILRMAVLEGFILKLTPPKVVIDESIELTKEYCNDQSRKFVSGVLGAIYDNFKNTFNE